MHSYSSPPAKRLKLSNLDESTSSTNSSESEAAAVDINQPSLENEDPSQNDQPEDKKIPTLEVEKDKDTYKDDNSESNSRVLQEPPFVELNKQPKLLEPSLPIDKISDDKSDNDTKVVEPSVDKQFDQQHVVPNVNVDKENKTNKEDNDSNSGSTVSEDPPVVKYNKQTQQLDVLNDSIDGNQYNDNTDFWIELFQSEVPKDGAIGQQERSYRRSFPNRCILTIDAVGTKNFDDAVSIEELPGVGYEYSLHVADTSFYVRPDTDLDILAKKNLKPKRRESMLTNDVKKMCSLEPGVEKRAVSCVWTLGTDFLPIGDCRFFRSLVTSNCSLTMNEAQDMWDKPEGYFTQVEVFGKTTIKKVVETCRLLRNFVNALRRKRSKEEINCTQHMIQILMTLYSRAAAVLIIRVEKEAAIVRVRSVGFVVIDRSDPVDNEDEDDVVAPTTSPNRCYKNLLMQRILTGSIRQGPVVSRAIEYRIKLIEELNCLKRKRCDG